MERIITKNQLQLDVVEKFLAVKKGYFLATGGVGKTITAIKCALSLGNKKVHVVVPRTILKEQWEEILKVWKCEAEVFVINTYINTPMECEVLIIDEAHMLVGELAICFNRVLHESKCEYFLALSATLNKEHKESFHNKGIPLLREVTFREAINNEWVVPVIEHNVYLILTPEEKVRYDEAQKMYLFYFKTFFSSWDNMKRCLGKDTIDAYVEERNRGIPLNSPLYTPKSKLQHHAAQYMQWVRKRKEIIYLASNKIKECLSLISKHNGEKIIIFSESTTFCNTLSTYIPEAKLYHSGLSAKVKKQNLESFLKGETRILIGAKSVDQGFDDPQVTVGIITSGTSSDVQHRQRLYRFNRYVRDKVSNLYNLIIQDSQEIQWNLKKQKYSDAIEYEKK